jgi:hypothetical protein
LKNLVKNQRGSIMLEFAICGILFVGFVLGMVAMGLWIYNTSQVRQAARIAALNVAVTDNPAEASDKALKHLNNTLVACPVKNAAAHSTGDSGYGLAEVEMNPLFPGFQRLIDPKGASTVNGRILIRKEALTARAHRLRPENRPLYN